MSEARGIPPPGSWYRLRLTRQRVHLPRGCWCCGAGGEGAWREVAEVDPGAVSLCETCRDHQSRLQELSGLLLFLGALLQVGAWWAWRGPGVTERAPLLLFSVLLLAGWAPLLLQRWAAPLVPLGPGHACRGRPAVLGRDRVGLTLEVSGGVLASWLARENAALPTPTRARDPDRDPVLSPFRGAGARVALPLGITALLGACELLGFFS